MRRKRVQYVHHIQQLFTPFDRSLTKNYKYTHNLVTFALCRLAADYRHALRGRLLEDAAHARLRGGHVLHHVQQVSASTVTYVVFGS